VTKLLLIAVVVIVLLFIVVIITSSSDIIISGSLIDENIKDLTYDPPRTNIELSVICASQAQEAGRQNNAFVDVDEYCSQIIQGCASYQFTIQECYAVYFVDPSVPLPAYIVESIKEKIR
jgi:hypothetical protein